MKDTVRLMSTCSCSNEYVDPPALAVYSIDPDTAKFIIRMASLVHREGTYKVEKFDYRVSWLRDCPLVDEGGEEEFPDMSKPEEAPNGLDWDEDNEVAMDAPCLCISDDDFWFTCYFSHCDNEIRTLNMPIADLAAYFGLTFVPPNRVTNWVSSFYETSPLVPWFEGIWGVGDAAAALTLTSDKTLVVANGDRSVFYRMENLAGAVLVTSVTDPINLVDPTADVLSLGSFETAEDGFRAICSREGWSNAPTPEQIAGEGVNDFPAACAVEKRLPILAVTVEGGLVQAVISDDPATIRVLDVLIIDYDIEGSQGDAIVPVPQSDGQEVKACVYPFGKVEAAGIDLKATLERIRG